MHSLDKLNVIAIGFQDDYSMLDLASLNRYMPVNFVDVPKILKLIITRFFYFSEKTSVKLLTLYMRMKFRNCESYLSGNFILLTNDSIIGLLSLKAIHVSEPFFKIMLLRNSYQHSKVELGLDNVYYYSFDTKDCELYNFTQYPQYCSGFHYLLSKGISCDNSLDDKCFDYDFYFLGLNKGRKEHLDYFRKLLIDYNLFIDIKELPSNFQKVINVIFSNIKYINTPYLTHLENVLKTRVVIDVVKPGQAGITMRTLEALLANKKVITNNPHVSKESFYNSNNIFIYDCLDEVSLDNLSRFLDAPYVSVNEEIKIKYEPGYVISSVIADACRKNNSCN